METVEVTNRNERSYSEKPNNSDTISRQAAIRWIKTECNPYGKPTLDYETSCRIMEHLDKMPSAQPKIIRCKDCKHYREYDSEYVENAVVVQCMADRYPISETIPDGWFCAGAERKDDE